MSKIDNISFEVEVDNGEIYFSTECGSGAKYRCTNEKEFFAAIRKYLFCYFDVKENNSCSTEKVNYDCDMCANDGYCMLYGHPCASMGCSEKIGKEEK